MGLGSRNASERSTTRKEVRKIRRPDVLFPELWAVVHKAHVRVQQQHGHGPEHPWVVARFAIWIAGEDELFGDLACIAALCHDADHILRKKGVGGAAGPEEVRCLVGQWLKEAEINLPDTWNFLVEDAVINHASPNSEDDSAVLQILKDADRLAGLVFSVTDRGAQAYPNLPVVRLDRVKKRREELILLLKLILFGTRPPVEPTEVYWKAPEDLIMNLMGCLWWATTSSAQGIRDRRARKLARKMALPVWFSRWLILREYTQYSKIAPPCNTSQFR
jgi:hypothetical protein